jgi:hypothetical protein
MVTRDPDMTAQPGTGAPSSTLAWVLIASGLILFPVAWTAVIVGRAVEVRPLMRFLARSDAHVFFDLPGVLANLRAFSILFAVLPATGAALVATGVASRSGRSLVSALVVGIGIGVGAAALAWGIVVFVITP